MMLSLEYQLSHYCEDAFVVMYQYSHDCDDAFVEVYQCYMYDGYNLSSALLLTLSVSYLLMLLT